MWCLPPKNGFPNKFFIITITKKVVYYVNSAQCTIQLHLVHVVCITVFYLTIFPIGSWTPNSITGKSWRVEKQVWSGCGSHSFHRQYPRVTEVSRHSRPTAVLVKANQDEEGKIINTITIHFSFMFNFQIIDFKRIHVMLTCVRSETCIDKIRVKYFYFSK